MLRGTQLLDAGGFCGLVGVGTAFPLTCKVPITSDGLLPFNKKTYEKNTSRAFWPFWNSPICVRKGRLKDFLSQPSCENPFSLSHLVIFVSDFPSYI